MRQVWRGKKKTYENAQKQNIVGSFQAQVDQSIAPFNTF